MGKEGKRGWWDDEEAIKKRPRAPCNRGGPPPSPSAAAMWLYRVRVYITAAGRGTTGAMSTGCDKIMVLQKYCASEEVLNSLIFLFEAYLFSLSYFCIYWGKPPPPDLVHCIAE